MLNQTRLMITLIVSCLSFTAAAEVYKTVDKNGRVTYSDVPPADSSAKPVELKTINSLPKPPSVPVTAAPAPAPAQEYQVRLTAPANGTTLLASERSVEIVADLNGQSVTDGLLLSFKVDGNEIQKTGETSITFANPPPGEHKLSVDLVDEENHVLAQSEAVTLLVMRPIFKQPTAPAPKK